MIQILRKLRVSTLLILMVQVLLTGAIIIAYYYDFLQIRTYVSLAVIVGIVSLLTVFNIMFMLSFLATMIKHREQLDLKVSELLGSDIPEAYQYAGLGLIIVDDDDRVIWMNEVIQDLELGLFENHLLTWNAQLQTIKENPKGTVEITLDDRIFSVRYLPNSKMYLFKDISALNALITVYQNESMVLGVAILDNYELNAPVFDESSDYISRIRAELIAYFNAFGISAKKIRSDSYMLIGQFQSLEKMKADKFSILQKIYQLDRGPNKRISISVGLASGKGVDVEKLDKMAFAAVELAVARGGNQAIIDHLTSKETFGGYQLAEENDMRLSVRTRERNNNLLRVIQDAKHVYVVGHLDTDMDALGAALGVRALCEALHVPVKVVFDYATAEKRATAAASTMFNVPETKSIFMSAKEALNKVKAQDLVIVVDVSRPESVVGSGMLDKNSSIAIIDHHKRGEQFINQVTIEPIIDTSASSTTEMIVDMMMHNDVLSVDLLNLSKAVTTIMLAGIYLDTNFFKSNEVGSRTFQAARFLMDQGADSFKAHELLKEDLEELAVIHRIMGNLKTLHTGVYMGSFDEEQVNLDSSLLAKTANAVMDMRGVNAVFILGKVQDGKVRISARSDGSINVAFILEKLGSGGGHHTMAGYESEKEVTIQTTQQALIHIVEQYIQLAQQEG